MIRKQEIPIPSVVCRPIEMMTWRRFLFSYKGRISRIEYRNYSFCCIAFLVAIYVLLHIFPTLIGLCQAISFLAAYTMFPTTAKRIQDLNYPGWFVLRMFAPLIIAFFINITWVYYIAPIPTMFWGGIGCFFMEGTPGPNKYGESPRYRSIFKIW